MAKVTFDGSSKLMILNTNVNNINVGVDLYSEWKRWSLLSNNTKYLPAFSVIGGEYISDTKKLGATYFFTNGWKLRPYEGNHTLQINGNLYCDDGSVPFINTIGVYNVNIISTVSSIVDREVFTSSGGGSGNTDTYANSCDCIYVDINSTTVGTTYPSGTRTYPVNNLNDAITICENNGICHLAFLSNITINKTLKNYIINGLGSSISFNGSNLINVTVTGASVTGNILGNPTFEYCNLSNISIESANIIKSNLSGYITINGSYLNIDNSYSSYETPIIINTNSNGISIINSRSFIGAIILKNSIHNNVFNIHVDSGSIIVDSTCIDGIYNISGICNIVNYSNLNISDQYIITTKNINTNLMNYDMNDINDGENTFGNYVKNKLLTVFRFIGLK